MKQEFASLYDLMANQQDVKYMRVFGNVHREMMDWFIQNKPDLAQEWLDKLESIRWHQYLTPKEAEKILAGMDPAAPWKRDQWKSVMEGLGLPLEESPYYNSCALFVEMNKQHSDHAQSLADKVWKKPLSAIPTEELIPVIHALAIDVLRDKDGVYNIRSYFGL